MKLASPCLRRFAKIFCATALVIRCCPHRNGDGQSRGLDGAIDQSRAVVDDLFNSGEGVWTAVPTTVLVEALVQRGAEGDLQEAQAAIDRLAEISTEFPFEVPLLRLRALVARAGRRGWLPGVRGSAIGRWRRRSASRGIWRWPPP